MGRGRPGAPRPGEPGRMRRWVQRPGWPGRGLCASPQAPPPTRGARGAAALARSPHPSLGRWRPRSGTQGRYAEICGGRTTAGCCAGTNRRTTDGPCGAAARATRAACSPTAVRTARFRVFARLCCLARACRGRSRRRAAGIAHRAGRGAPWRCLLRRFMFILVWAPRSRGARAARGRRPFCAGRTLRASGRQAAQVVVRHPACFGVRHFAPGRCEETRGRSRMGRAALV